MISCIAALGFSFAAITLMPMATTPASNVNPNLRICPP
jgi:hypothetical protein